MSLFIPSIATNSVASQTKSNKKKIPPLYIALGAIATTGAVAIAFTYLGKKNPSSLLSDKELSKNLASCEPTSSVASVANSPQASENPIDPNYYGRMQILLEYEKTRPDAILSLKKYLKDKPFDEQTIPLYTLFFPHLKLEEEKQSIFDKWKKALSDLSSPGTQDNKLNLHLLNDLWLLFLKEAKLKEEAYSYKDSFRDWGYTNKDILQKLYNTSSKEGVQAFIAPLVKTFSQKPDVLNVLAWLYTNFDLKDKLFNDLSQPDKQDYFHYNFTPLIQEADLHPTHKESFLRFANDLNISKIYQERGNIDFLKYLLFFKGVKEENKAIAFVIISALDPKLMVELCLAPNFPLDKNSLDLVSKVKVGIFQLGYLYFYNDFYASFLNLASANKGQELTEDETYLALKHCSLDEPKLLEISKKGCFKFKKDTKLAFFYLLTQEDKKKALDKYLESYKKEEDFCKSSLLALALFHKDKATYKSHLEDKISLYLNNDLLELCKVSFLNTLEPEDRDWLFKCFIQFLIKVDKSYCLSSNDQIHPIFKAFANYPEYQLAILQLLLNSFESYFVPKIILNDDDPFVDLFLTLLPKVMANTSISLKKRKALQQQAKEIFEPFYQNNEIQTQLKTTKILAHILNTPPSSSEDAVTSPIELACFEKKDEKEKSLELKPLFMPQHMLDTFDHFLSLKKLLTDKTYKETIVAQLKEILSKTNYEEGKLYFHALLFPYLNSTEKKAVFEKWEESIKSDQKNDITTLLLMISFLEDKNYQSQAKVYFSLFWELKEFRDLLSELNIIIFDNVMTKIPETLIPFACSIGIEKLQSNDQQKCIEAIKAMSSFEDFDIETLSAICLIQNLKENSKNKAFESLVKAKDVEVIDLCMKLYQHPQFSLPQEIIEKMLAETVDKNNEMSAPLIMLFLERKLDEIETWTFIQYYFCHHKPKAIHLLAKQGRLTLDIDCAYAIYDPGLRPQVLQKYRDPSRETTDPVEAMIVAIFDQNTTYYKSMAKRFRGEDNDEIKEKIFSLLNQKENAAEQFFKVFIQELKYREKFLLNNRDIYTLVLLGKHTNCTLSVIKFLLKNLSPTQLFTYLEYTWDESLLTGLFEKVQKTPQYSGLVNQLKNLLRPLLKHKNPNVLFVALKFLLHIL